MDIFYRESNSVLDLWYFCRCIWNAVYFIKSMESAYKYIMTFMLLTMSYIMVQAFNESPAVFQMVYFTLAVSLIYLSERLILILGG